MWRLRPPALSGGRNRDPPSVRLTAPLPDATVTGEVSLSAKAADEATVARVEFFIDGARLGERTARPYRMQWNTASVKPETWRSSPRSPAIARDNRSEARQKVRMAGVSPVGGARTAEDRAKIDDRVPAGEARRRTGTEREVG